MPRVFTKDQSEITARLGQPFVIELESSPTTGYRWEPQLDAEKLILEATAIKTHSPSDIGSATLERFTLKPIDQGETVIRLCYKRPWEQQPIDEHVVHVHVR